MPVVFGHIGDQKTTGIAMSTGQFTLVQASGRCGKSTFGLNVMALSS